MHKGDYSGVESARGCFRSVGRPNEVGVGGRLQRESQCNGDLKMRIEFRGGTEEPRMDGWMDAIV